MVDVGASNDQWDAFDDGKNIWIGVIVGVGAGLLCAATIIPYLRWKIPQELAATTRYLNQLSTQDSMVPSWLCLKIKPHADT